MKAEKRTLAGMCAIAAMLSGFAFASPAMAAESGLTLKAAEGNTLAGHTFTVYKLGGYYDVATEGDKVASYTVRGDAASNAWAKDAIDTYNAASSSDITIPLGYDEAGAIASLADKGTATQIRAAAKELAESKKLPTAVKTVEGSGDQINISVDDGYYLVVDSEGAPMLIGTKIDGKDLKNGTLGETVIKSKALTVDKKIGADEDSLKDDGSYTVGSTVKQTITTTIPNNKLGGALAWKIVDTPDGLEYVDGSLTAQLKDGTDVTSLVTPTTSGTVSGDASLVDAGGQRTDPDLTVPNKGFVIDGASLMEAHPNKQVVITYNAKVTKGEASNVANITTVFADGIDTTKVTDEDEATSTAYDFGLDKTSYDDPTQKVNGAGFKIKDNDLDKWLSYDYATGMWSEASGEDQATEFFTGDTTHDGTVDSSDDTSKAGHIEFADLGAGEYTIEETTAPVGFSSYDIAMPSLTVTISEDGTVMFTGKDLPNLTTDDGDGSVTVADIASLKDLPQTGGAWSIIPWIVAALAAGGIGLGAMRIGRQGRRTITR